MNKFSPLIFFAALMIASPVVANGNSNGPGQGDGSCVGNCPGNGSGDGDGTTNHNYTIVLNFDGNAILNKQVTVDGVVKATTKNVDVVINNVGNSAVRLNNNNVTAFASINNSTNVVELNQATIGAIVNYQSGTDVRSIASTRNVTVNVNSFGHNSVRVNNNTIGSVATINNAVNRVGNATNTSTF